VWFSFFTLDGEPPITGLIEISKHYPDAIFVLKNNDVECDYCLAAVCKNGIAMREVFKFSELVQLWMEEFKGEFDFRSRLRDGEGEDDIVDWVVIDHYYEIIDWVLDPVGDILTTLIQIQNPVASAIDYLLGSHSIQIGCEQITSGHPGIREEDLKRHRLDQLSITA
jgi:hypothetical protein